MKVVVKMVDRRPQTKRFDTLEPGVLFTTCAYYKPGVPINGNHVWMKVRHWNDDVADDLTGLGCDAINFDGKLTGFSAHCECILVEGEVVITGLVD